MSRVDDALSSDGDEDFVHVAPGGIPISKGRADLHRSIAKMKEVAFSDDDGDSFVSPVGSPNPNEAFSLGGRGKFLELKRKIENDQANRSKAMMETDDNISEVMSAIDVTALLESLNSDKEFREQTRASAMSSVRLDNHPKFIEMYKQIKDRDHKILDLESRLNEMHREAVDLQDTINQRDQLISSKNEAISMIHIKHRKELDQKDEELRKTQITMIELERNLSGIQDRFNEDKDRLVQELKVHQRNMDNLRNEMETMRVDFNKINDELAHAQFETERLLQAIAEKDTVIAEKEAKIEELKTSTAKHETTLKKMKAQFQTKLKTMKEKQMEHEEKSKLLQVEIGQHEEQRDKQLERIRLLEAAANELNEEILKVKSENEMLEGKLLERTSEVESLLEEKVLKEQDNDVVNVSAVSDLGERVKELESKIADLEKNIASKSEDAQVLEASVAELNEEILQIKSQNETLASKLLDKNNELELLILEKNLKNEQTKMDEVDLSAPGDEEREREWHSRIIELEEEIAKKADQTQMLEISMNELNQEILKVKAENQEFEARLKESNAKFESLGWEHEEALQSCKELSDKMKDLTENLVSEASQKTTNELGVQVDDIENLKEIHKLRVEIDSLTSQLNGMEGEVWRLEAEKEQLMKNKWDKDALISENEIEIQKLNSSISKQDATLKKMKVQFQTKLKALKDHQSEHEEKTNKLEAYIAQLEDEKDKQTEHIQTLESSLHEIRNQILQMTLEKETLEMKLQDKTVEFDRLTQSQMLKEQPSDWSEVNLVAPNTDEQVNTQESKIMELEEVIVKKSEETRLLETALSDLNAEILQVKSEKNALEIRLDSCTKKFESLEWEHEEVLQNCEDLSKKVRELTESLVIEQTRKVPATAEIGIQADDEDEKKEIEKLRNELTNLGSKVEVLECDIWRLESEKEQAFKTIAQKDALILENEERLQQELNLSNTKQDAALKKIKVQFQAKLKDLKDQLLEHQDKTKELEIYIAELKNERVKETEHMQVLKNSLDESKEHVYGLNLVKEKLEIKLEERATEVENLKQEQVKLNELLREKSESVEKIIQMESRIAELGEEIAKKSEHAQSLEASLSEFEVGALKLNFQKEELEAKILEQRKEIELLIQQKASREEEIADSIAKATGQRVRDLEFKITELEGEIENKTIQTRTLENSLNQMSQEILMIRSEKESLGHRLQESTTELESLGWKHEEVLQNCDDLSKRVVELTENAVVEQTPKAFVTNEVGIQAGGEEEEQKAIEKLQTEMDRLDKRAEELEEDVWRLEAEKEKLLKTISQKNAIISENEVKVDELNSSMNRQDIMLKKLKAQFQAKLKSLKEKHTETGEAGYSSGSPTSGERVKELEARIAELEEERVKQFEQTRMLQNSLNEINEQVRQVKLEKEVLEVKLQDCALPVAAEPLVQSKLVKEQEAVWNDIDLGTTTDVQRIRELETRISGLEDEIFGKIEYIRTLESQIRKVNDIFQVNFQVDCERETFECDLRTRMNDFRSLEWQHEKVLQKSKELSTKVEELQAKLSQDSALYYAHLMEKDAQLQELNGIVATLRTESAEFQTLRADLEMRYVQAQKELMDAQFKCKSLQEKLDGIQTKESSDRILQLERKVELLQGKIEEIEQSEMKCFEETLLLKSWTRELEMDCQKKQMELDLYKNAADGESSNIKATILQNEVMRLVNELQGRDRRCEELTAEITQLLEERDDLQLKLSNILEKNTSKEAKKEGLHGEFPSYGSESLSQKIIDLEEKNYIINMDLRREREARRLVQEQLFFSQSSRSYNPRSRSPVSSPLSPSIRTPPRPSISSPVSTTPFIPATTPIPTGETLLIPSSSLQFPPPIPDTQEYQSQNLLTVEFDKGSVIQPRTGP